MWIYYTKDKKSQPLARLRFSAVSDWTQCGTSSLELSEKSPTTKKQSKLCSSILVFECVSEIPRVHPVCVFRPLCFFQLLKRYQEGARGHIVHRENLVVESPNKFVTTRGEKKGTNNNREKWAVVKCVVLLFRIFLAPFYVSSEKVKTCRAQSSHEK
jgi:hypothetical protein